MVRRSRDADLGCPGPPQSSGQRGASEPYTQHSESFPPDLALTAQFSGRLPADVAVA